MSDVWWVEDEEENHKPTIDRLENGWIFHLLSLLSRRREKLVSKGVDYSIVNENDHHLSVELSRSYKWFI